MESPPNSLSTSSMPHYHTLPLLQLIGLSARVLKSLNPKRDHLPLILPHCPFFISHIFLSAHPASCTLSWWSWPTHSPLELGFTNHGRLPLTLVLPALAASLQVPSSMWLHDSVISSAGPATSLPLLSYMDVGAGQLDARTANVRLGCETLPRVSAFSKLSSSGQ